MISHFRVISYDISDDAGRRRLEKLVLRLAARVQYSVFEAWLTDAQVARLLARAEPLVRPPSDSLRVYRLCGACVEQVDCLGDGPSPDLPAEVVA